ncbi:hypothetical protein H5T88_03620 [bacterium]|nr:hypothetical protein [bacterium]
MRDALNNITQYQYDANGNLTKVVDGKLKVKTDGRGWKTYFFYDSVGRLMHKLYGNGTGEGCNYDAMGRLTSHTNPALGELGYYGDGDAGMYLLTQRWYNPTIGRFVARDPIKNKKNFLCYEWYLECIRGAAEDVRECILVVMGHGWIPVLETVECTLTCGVACIASGPAWSGCMEACLGACGWAFGAIDVIALKPCYEIAKIEKESCEDAYRWCCRHAE